MYYTRPWHSIHFHMDVHFVQTPQPYTTDDVYRHHVVYLYAVYRIPNVCVVVVCIMYISCAQSMWAGYIFFFFYLYIQIVSISLPLVLSASIAVPSILLMFGSDNEISVCTLVDTACLAVTYFVIIIIIIIIEWMQCVYSMAAGRRRRRCRRRCRRCRRRCVDICLLFSNNCSTINHWCMTFTSNKVSDCTLRFCLRWMVESCLHFNNHKNK